MTKQIIIYITTWTDTGYTVSKVDYMKINKHNHYNKINLLINWFKSSLNLIILILHDEMFNRQ